MAGWRIVTRALYDLGGEALAHDIGQRAGGLMAVDSQTTGHALQNAERLGLVTKRPADHGHRNVWSLTGIGWAWAHGRVTQERPPKGSPRPRARRWVEVVA